MRYSRLVALGLVASAMGLFGTIGCSSDSDTTVSAPPKKDAGTDADAMPDAKPDVEASTPDAEAGVDADADVTPPCPTVTIVEPVDGAKLDANDDADGDACANGFQYDVSVATNAPDGTTVSLYGESGKIADATAQNSVARFENVQLTSNGTETLRAEIASTACTVEDEVTVTIECEAPSCELSKPVISATHPELNGVSVAEGGDRVSAPGSAYQVAFEVTTSIEDGQPVILNVDGNVSAVSANAVGGVATFAGVTLTPDGVHTVTARCVPLSGVEGFSTATSYTVDTVAPPLTARKVKENGVVSNLEDGDHWNPADDADAAAPGLQIRVCGTTDKATAPDALDLPASLGSGQQNFCVAVGTSSPECLAATTGGAGTAGDGACVNIDCPGGGPFNLTLTLRDDAGNPTAETVQAVTCASELPQVQFVDPVSDGPPWSDMSKRILSNSMPDPQRKDNDPVAPGAQYDVIACTSVTSGTAELFAGPQGGAMDSIGTGTVAADTGGLCGTSGLPGVITFADVTLPQSAEDSSFELVTPTSLRVDVTDESNGVGSANVSLWVDSTAPSLSIGQPEALCGMIVQSAADYVTPVRFLTSVAPVHLTVNSTPYQGDTLMLGTVEIQNVTFPLGTNTVAAYVEEPAGNIGRTPTPCTVTVGDVPTVTWQTPVQGSKLAASTTTGTGVIPDGDSVAPNWQGTLRVCTNIDMAANPGATVQFSTNLLGDIGSPVALDGSGCAERPNTDLPESDVLVLTATTSTIGAFTGSASITVPVDATIPSTPTELTPTVLDRRQTSFHLAWTAPADGTKNAADYEIRVANAAIDTEAKFAAAAVVDYTGAPAPGGSPDGIDVTDRLIEQDYFFAVRAIDGAGNRGAIAHSTTAIKASFRQLILSSGVTNEQFGYFVDGSADLTGDGLSDMLVGTYNGRTGYFYKGTGTGFVSTPSVTFTGSTIGYAGPITSVGDINGDGDPTSLHLLCSTETARSSCSMVRTRAGLPRWTSRKRTLSSAQTVAPIPGSRARFLDGTSRA
ncbi:lysyl endopeptidase precursor [sediment metagenome]|uniref:Lysyl endopeptidase n=1 Tax=sediment metagenome TaxID=749907 RepID=D9PI11_9ZZZZ